MSLKPAGLASIKTLNRSYAINTLANTIDLLLLLCLQKVECVCVEELTMDLKLIVCEINPKELTFISLRACVPRVNKLPFSSTA